MAKDYAKQIVDLESRYSRDNKCLFTGFQKHEPTNVTTNSADCFIVGSTLEFFQWKLKFLLINVDQ